MTAIASTTDQRSAEDFSSDEPPLVRGGNDSVYQVTAHRSTGLSWRHGAARGVAEACTSYDDACVGEVAGLGVRIDSSGEVRFDIELTLSTKYRPASHQAQGTPT